MTDAELVAGHLAGDRGALAAIYDRYADSLYDTAAAMTGRREDAADVLQDVFVAAAERLGQLRDPDKLKPWLFAILRNEVYRRTRRKRRTVATDFTDPVAEMAVPSQSADDATSVEYEELAALVRAAAAGLDERDQLVLELSVRQGLQGDDLANALGVSTQQSYGLLHRMRQRTERSLGAYCVARGGRKDCPDLAQILQGWDGEFSVLIRKRVARHVDGCDVCERSRKTLAPFALFGAAPALAAPSDLRERILGAATRPHAEPPYGFEAPGGFPSLVRHGRRFVLWILVAAAVLLVSLSAAVYVLADDEAATLAIDATPGTTLASAPTVAEPDAGAAFPADDEGAAGSADGGPGGDDGTTSTTTTPAPTGNDGGAAVDPVTTTTVASAPPVVIVMGTTIPSGSATTTTPSAAPPVLPTTTAPATSTPATTTSTAPPATTATAPTTSTTTTSTTVPGSLTVSAGTVDFGTLRSSATITLSNTGGQPVSWSTSTGPIALRGAPSPYSFSPVNGTLQPGSAVNVVVSIDRASQQEGATPSQRVTFFADGTSASVDLTAVIARPPILRPVSVPPARDCVRGTNGLWWEVGIGDESPPIRAFVDVMTPGGATITDVLTQDGNWFGGMAPNELDTDGDGLAEVGVYAWKIRASDAFGNTATAEGTTSLGTDRLHC